MSGQGILTLITVFVLSAFVGFEVISKVPSILHTPLMSGTNAVHGVVLVGSMIVLGTSRGTLEITLGFVAVVLSTVNVVGGFVVTDRMLEMFKGRQPARPAPAAAPARPADGSGAAGDGRGESATAAGRDDTVVMEPDDTLLLEVGDGVVTEPGGAGPEQ